MTFVKLLRRDGTYGSAVRVPSIDAYEPGDTEGTPYVVVYTKGGRRWHSYETVDRFEQRLQVAAELKW